MITGISNRVLVDLEQGSQEWLDFRAEKYPASEAPSVNRSVKYGPKSPEELALSRKGDKLREVSEYVQKHIFDPGHEAEEYARIILSEMKGKKFANLVGKVTVEGLKRELAASYDGIDRFMEDLFEHKNFHEKIKEEIECGELHGQYTFQMDHQLLVSGGKKVWFVTSDSFRAEPELFEAIKDDLMAYSSLQEDENGSFYACAHHFYIYEYTSNDEKLGAIVEAWKEYEEIEDRVIIEDEEWSKNAAKFSELYLQRSKLSAKIKPYEKELESLKAQVSKALSLAKKEKEGYATESFKGKFNTRASSILPEKLSSHMNEGDIESCMVQSSYWIYSPAVKLSKEDLTAIQEEADTDDSNLDCEEIIETIEIGSDEWKRKTSRILEIQSIKKSLDAEIRSLKAKMEPYQSAMTEIAEGTGLVKLLGNGVEATKVVKSPTPNKSKLLDFIDEKTIDLCRDKPITFWQFSEPSTPKAKKATTAKKATKPKGKPGSAKKVTKIQGQAYFQEQEERMIALLLKKG